MKVVAFNGSPRKNGNTKIALETVAKELEKEGIKTEIIQLGGLGIRSCKACMTCFSKQNKKCIIEDDPINEMIAKIEDSDGLLIGSPVYFSSVSSEVKAFIDRVGLVAKANGDLFKRKVGAAVVAVRRAGACPTFSQINYFFFIGQMIVPGSSYWNLGIGLSPGEIEDDAEGMQTFRTLGINMAWLIKKLKV